MVSLSAFSPAISSSTGATILQGPHHSAQKSTSTGLSLCSTSATKLASVTVLVLAPIVWLLKRGQSVSGQNVAVRGGHSPRAASQRSASSAAAQPVPAAVIACR